MARRVERDVPQSACGEAVAVAPFEVVGVMEEKVQLSNYNRPDKYCIFIPWTTMGGLSDTRYVGTFVWQAVSPMLEAKGRGTPERRRRRAAPT